MLRTSKLLLQGLLLLAFCFLAACADEIDEGKEPEPAGIDEDELPPPPEGPHLYAVLNQEAQIYQDNQLQTSQSRGLRHISGKDVTDPDAIRTLQLVFPDTLSAGEYAFSAPEEISLSYMEGGQALPLSSGSLTLDTNSASACVGSFSAQLREPGSRDALLMTNGSFRVEK